jgi:hypothetical protein
MVMKIRSNIAMRVVNLDRLKFNQAVSDEYYPCAPMTVAGSVRLFEEGDLVTLYVFARLLELGVLPRHAGQLACELYHALRAHEDAGSVLDRITYVRGLDGDFFNIPYDPDHSPNGYDPNHEKRGMQYGVGSVVLTMDFYIVTIRRHIKAGIERERSIIGVEGADD